VTIPSALLAFAALAAVLTVIPGLDTTLVLRSALTQSRRHAFVTALGIGTGALAWGAAAAVGAAALLAASEVAYRALTILGAAYMAYLGVVLIVRSFRHTAVALEQLAPKISLWRVFLTGAGTNLLNPKIGVFYVATIPQFIPEGVSHLGMGLLLAGVHDVIGLLWFAGIIWGAQAARRWLANARALKVIDRVAGVVLVGFGARLVLDRH
jgi:threonine/homoserine/homoserine lactone efflux protein